MKMYTYVMKKFRWTGMHVRFNAQCSLKLSDMNKNSDGKKIFHEI